MPKLEMNNASLKYCFCFLPVTGLIVGAAEIIWLMICVRLGFSSTLFGAVACIVPLAVTGGIHMDGYADTSDALSSHAEISRKHMILDDPYIGAFSVISSIAYMLLSFAAFQEIYGMIGGDDGLWVLSAEGAARPAGRRILDFALSLLIVFAASRAVAAFAAVSIKMSKKNGMLYMLVIFADRKALAAVSAIALILCCVAAFAIFGLSALSFPVSIIAVYIYFRIMAVRQFGGISGDLCGWLIQIMEIVLLLILVFLFR